MNKKYIIVSDITKEGLEDQVNSYIMNGYKPQGGIYVYNDVVSRFY
jgi:hypothetical protein